MKREYTDGCRTKFFILLVGTARCAVRASQRDAPTIEESCHAPDTGHYDFPGERGRLDRTRRRLADEIPHCSGSIRAPACRGRRPRRPLSFPGTSNPFVPVGVPPAESFKISCQPPDSGAGVKWSGG